MFRGRVFFRLLLYGMLTIASRLHSAQKTAIRIVEFKYNGSETRVCNYKWHKLTRSNRSVFLTNFLQD